MPLRRPNVDRSREAYRPGKARISQIINLKNVDFGVNRNNRYMRTGASVPKLPNTSITSVRSNSKNRHLAAFKNPLLNSYDYDGEEEFQPKHYDFDFYDGNEKSLKAKVKKTRSRDNLRDTRALTRREAEAAENENGEVTLSFDEIRRRRDREKKEMEIIENARRLKDFEESERLEKQKRKERNARREKQRMEKENKIKSRNGVNTRQSQVSVNEKKVGKTVKMIEQLLNESKQPKKILDERASSDSENRYYDVVNLNKKNSKKRQQSTANTHASRRGPAAASHKSNYPSSGVQRHDGSSRRVSSKNSRNNDSRGASHNRDEDNYDSFLRHSVESRNERTKMSKNDSNVKKRGRTRSKNKKPSDVTETEKQKYFAERNIVVNEAIDDIDEYESSTVIKPRKINLQREKSNFQREGSNLNLSRERSTLNRGKTAVRSRNASRGTSRENRQYSRDHSQLSDKAYEADREQFKATSFSRNNNSNSQASSDRDSNASVKSISRVAKLRDNSRSKKSQPPSAGTKGLTKRSSSNNLLAMNNTNNPKSAKPIEKERSSDQFTRASSFRQDKSAVQNNKERVSAKNNIEQISDKNVGRTQIVRDYNNARSNDGTQTRKDSSGSLPSPTFTPSPRTQVTLSSSEDSETDSSEELDHNSQARKPQDLSNNKFNTSTNSEESSEKELLESRPKSSYQSLPVPTNSDNINSSDANDYTTKQTKKKYYNTHLLQRLAHISQELSKDHLQFSPNAKTYVTALIDDVQKIVSDVDKEKDLYVKQAASAGASRRDMTRQEMEQVRFDAKEKTLINFNEKEINYRSNKQNDTGKEYSNSLGLTMEGKNGIYLAIIKGTTSELDLDESINSHKNNKMRGEKEEQILLRKNYQNLEDLITHTMGYDDYDSHYLKIAKLNRLKVLMETSMKIVGRPFNDISNEERTNLELEANRFHTTYPLPSEEVLLEEMDDSGEKSVRMPLKIVQEDGMAKIDINDNFVVDPSDFLTIYTTKLVEYAEETTGLKFNNMTLAIPATYGAAQREALKNSINDATDRDDVQILTRPVAAAVILNNQRNHDKDLANRKSFQNSSVSSYGSQSLSPEAFKLVFDMTEGSMDASVIRIKDSKDFHVISNVGDTSFGLHDLDERIVEYIINEKSKRKKRFKRNSEMESWSDHDLETVNAYANLIKNIKYNVEDVGAVAVDLLNMNDASQNPSKKKRKEDELYIDKNLISEKLCKDIYDWALAHIEKSIVQADLNDKDIDEIVVIGGPSKMPGFREYLKETYPYKRVSFVKEEELAVGAAIVGRKLKYQQIKVTEVLCRSIGIGLYTGVITYLLFRNSSLPCIGGCVYSTLVDDQESMVLDIYEGERPHVKFCRYLGEVTVFDLPKGPAGSVKCEIYLKMDHEGLLEVTAKDLDSGATLETAIDANPEHLLSDEVNNDTELDPLEAERYKKLDYDLVYQLEKLDEHLDELNEKYFEHPYSKHILEKIFDTKEWLYNNRRVVTVDECHSIRVAIEKFLTNITENLEE